MDNAPNWLEWKPSTPTDNADNGRQQPTATANGAATPAGSHCQSLSAAVSAVSRGGEIQTHDPDERVILAILQERGPQPHEWINASAREHDVDGIRVCLAIDRLRRRGTIRKRGRRWEMCS